MKINRWEFLLVCVGIGLVAGCRPPAVQQHNLRLISSLRTACSAQKSEWLEGVARAVELEHQAGRMSIAEQEHFQKLIELAREGHWQEAERGCLAFEKAQLNRARDRKT